MREHQVEKRDIVPAPADYDPPAAMGGEPAGLMEMMDPFGGRPTYMSNIDDATEYGRSLVLRGLNGADKKTEDVLGQELDVVYALVHPVRLVNRETGEEGYHPRIVLYLTDGTTVGFVSHGILSSLRTLARWRGPTAWEPPMRVRVRQVTTSNHRRTLVLDLVVPNQPAPSKKGGR
jgi:hypothetical protein